MACSYPLSLTGDWTLQALDPAQAISSKYALHAISVEALEQKGAGNGALRGGALSKASKD